MTLPLFPTVAEAVTELCAEGRANACLIDGSISEVIDQFQAAGWSWDGQELARPGWAAFFRSQGECGPAIVQWMRAA